MNSIVIQQIPITLKNYITELDLTFINVKYGQMDD
jgi:hypothetical protein